MPRPEAGAFTLVREGGFEPPHPFGYWHLKPARLPFRHSRILSKDRYKNPSNQQKQA